MPPISQNNVPSSFIPREIPRSSSVKRTGLADLLVLLATVLFVASCALAAGVFLYDQYLKADTASKLSQIQRAKAAFDPALIQEFTRLDDRMQVIGDLLAKHESYSRFFAVLQQSTIQNIEFSRLEIDAQSPGTIALKLQGVAQSVNTIALQADLFSKGGVIEGPIFSDIDRGQDGIHFSVTAKVNPTVLSYAQIAGAAASVPAQVFPQGTGGNVPVSQDTGTDSSPFGGPSSDTQ